MERPNCWPLKIGAQGVAEDSCWSGERLIGKWQRDQRRGIKLSARAWMVRGGQRGSVNLLRLKRAG